MLAAWRDHGELLLQHCDDCGAVIFYPRKRCPSCWSASLTNRASAGAGTIVTFSIVHRGVDEAFRREGQNVVLAVVKTDEGPQVITRIVGCEPSEVEIAQRVKLYANSDREGYPLPVYLIAAKEPGSPAPG
ncbi:Zn-ribbon domain-containing OB-fold protein [uncultured Caballeronia sp.]|uniref:Zn-ribbon domain-containing OB-fold protein n=1 Tax=uncultured Caballeronia sp. TaxID=1827198 RepID=UPI0035CA6355